MNYTPEQNKVFEFVASVDAHGIIDAVAGSGKTSTIIQSAKYIKSGYKALFCAFNSSIARTIRERFIYNNMPDITVKTIHALGFDILKSNSVKEYKVTSNKYEQIVERGLKSNEFNDELTQLIELNGLSVQPQNKAEEAMLRKFRFEFKVTLLDLVDKYRLTLTKDDIGEVLSLVQHFNIINRLQSSDIEFKEQVFVYFSICKKVIDKGNKIAKVFGEIDFTDMLYLPYVNAFSPKNKFDFLFIDECQDLSKSQFAIALKYVKAEGRVLAVGDPYQSIYGFTGADIESFARIQDKLKAHSLQLSSCFRCPDAVISMAKTFRSDIVAFHPKEGTVSWIEFDDVIKNVKPGNLIICRRKASLQYLMFLMIEMNIVVEVHEDEIKEFINDLKFLFTPEELKENSPLKHIAFFDTVSERNVQIIERKAKKISGYEDKEEFIRDENKILDRKLDFIRKQLVKQVSHLTISGLLKRLEELISGGKAAIKLSTIHRAKGLENDCVFILEYDKLPLKWDGQKDWERKQELNLQYVALTRSKCQLYLVRSDRNEASLIEESLFDTIGDF